MPFSLGLRIHEWKLKELKKRAARNSIDVVETRVIESQKVIKRLKGTADRLLLDVPCTGIGVLKRNPDTKWKFSLEEGEFDRSEAVTWEVKAAARGSKGRGGRGEAKAVSGGSQRP